MTVAFLCFLPFIQSPAELEKSFHTNDSHSEDFNLALLAGVHAGWVIRKENIKAAWNAIACHQTCRGSLIVHCFPHKRRHTPLDNYAAR
jgi:hypothetical protein